MLLRGALSHPVGRGTRLDPDAEAQLLGAQGSLTRQLARLHAAAEEEVRTLLGLRADLPPRRAAGWTLLTEGEHPAWGLLALGDPPPISAASAARLAVHLAAAHQALDRSQARAWAAEQGAAPTATWGDLLAEVSSTQTAHALLGRWGVLSAFVGLHPGDREQARTLLRAELNAAPTPTALAEASVWSALHPLHGGLPRPGRARIAALAASLREKAEARGPLPEHAALSAELAALLPSLSGEEVARMAEQLHGAPTPPGEDAVSGIRLVHRPGEVAYWLRRRRQVQLITCTRPEVEVRNWVWDLGTP